MSGSASNGMPGSLTRLGPAKLTGEARSDHTGSIRMLSPPAWMRRLVGPAGLDAQAGVADDRDAQSWARTARRRPIRMRARVGKRPFGFPAGAPPARDVAKALRRHAVGIEEAQPVEMTRERPVEIAGGGGARA